MGNLHNPSLVIGLLQVKAEPWQSIYENGQVPTWIETCPQSVEIINLYGRTPSKVVRFLDMVHEKLRWSPTLQGPVHMLDRFLTKFLSQVENPNWQIESKNNIKNLVVDFPSTNLTLPNVETALFRYFIKSTDADFLYISNTSSYVNTQNLLEFLKNLPKNNIYGGNMLNFAGIEFASGANRIISRDLVNFLIENFNNWDFQYLDDVSMGKLLTKVEVYKVEIPSIEFTEEHQINSSDITALQEAVHFRLKSGTRKKRKDAELMNLIHSKINS